MMKLKGLLLTEGLHGMISQVEGLAKALDLEYFHEKIELNNLWNFIPPKISPVSKFVFKNKIEKDFDLIISCGRKSVIPSIYYKQNLKRKIINIHIQNPKVSLQNFDFIVAPDHDGLTGKNVILSKGSIHYLTKEEIVNNHEYLSGRLNKEKEYLTLVVGGPNKYYDYNEKAVDEIFFKIKNNFLQKNYQLIVIPSIRTPKNIIQKTQSYFDKDQIIISNVDKKAYLSSLKLADHIVVMCDSTSMISEAAITGKPIYVAQMPSIKNNKRFKEFFNLFESLKIIKNLDNTVENWNYQKLNEINRISGYIKDKLKEYDFS